MTEHYYAQSKYVPACSMSPETYLVYCVIIVLYMCGQFPPLGQGIECLMPVALGL